MRRALARKPGWSSTIRTVSGTRSILLQSGPLRGTGSHTFRRGGPHPQTPASRIGAGSPRWEPGAVSPNPTERNPMQAKRNIAERAARWSAAHRKVAILGWIAFVVVSVVLGGAIGTKQLSGAEAGAGDSGRAALALEKAELTPSDEMVMVQSAKLGAGDPAFDEAVGEATRKLAAVPSVTHLSSPADGGGQVSADGHTALVEFQIPGTKDQAEERVEASLAATAAAQAAHPDVRVEQFGGASANKALEEVFSEDLKKAETTSLPITLVILLLAFGALVAALVPLLIGFSAVLATVSLLALPSQL